MIIILSGIIVFIGIYFFRVITVSYEEVRYRGLFSSKDSAIINKDKTLIITMYKHSRLGVCLYGNDGKPPMFEGLRDEGSIDIFLFRGRAVGGKRTVKSLLRYFGISEEDIALSFDRNEHTSEAENVTLDVRLCEDIKEFRIKFKETL